MIKKKYLQFTILFLIGLFLGGILTYFIFIPSNNLNDSYITPIMGRPLINFEGKVWTSNDLPDDLAIDYYNVENNMYNSLKYFSEKLALRLSLAQEMKKEITSKSIPKLSDLVKIPEAKESDAKKYYDDLVNKAGISVFGGQSFDKIKQQLLFQLNNERIVNFSSKKIDELVNLGKFKLLFDSPLGAPSNIDYSLYPYRGKENSNMVMISVIDYTDPKSREIQPELEKIYHRFSSKIKFINIPYSQYSNSLGGLFAKGAFCANEQGNDKYWDYNKKAFENSNKVSLDDINMKDVKNLNIKVMEVAKSSKLNLDKFSSCLNADKSKVTLQKTQNQMYSVNDFQGAPSFFLNKRPIRISLKVFEKSLDNSLN